MADILLTAFFKSIFLNENVAISIEISPNFFEGLSWQWVRIGSGNGMALNKRNIYVSLSIIELICLRYLYNMRDLLY